MHKKSSVEKGYGLGKKIQDGSIGGYRCSGKINHYNGSRQHTAKFSPIFVILQFYNAVLFLSNKMKK